MFCLVRWPNFHRTTDNKQPKYTKHRKRKSFLTTIPPDNGPNKWRRIVASHYDRKSKRKREKK